MKIVTLIPFFKEGIELTAECLNNVSSYADAAVVCVNDRYDKEVDEYLRSFPIVGRLSFVNKDIFSDAITNSSLLTMAQQLQPDWIVKQDIDEEFEPRFRNIRQFLSTTDLRWISVLWPSYVQDREHHCYFHHEHENGMTKPIIFRFDLDNLYVPASNIHSNIRMFTSKAGVIDIRLFHKNLLKSDRENYRKFVLSKRDKTGDKSFALLRKNNPQVLKYGSSPIDETFLKKEMDTKLFLRYSFVEEDIDQNLTLISTKNVAFNRQVLINYLSKFYNNQNVESRLTRECPKIRFTTILRKQVFAIANRFALVGKIRAYYQNNFK